VRPLRDLRRLCHPVDLLQARQAVVTRPG
jgi:hypothetical protein